MRLPWRKSKDVQRDLLDADIDGVLIQWGDRLFYPGNRVVKVKPQPKLNGDSARETCGEKLRGHGVEAEATRQATRGRNRNYDPLWRVKAREDGRLRTSRPSTKSSPNIRSTRAEAVEAWTEVGRALATSTDKADRDLARSIAAFIQEMPSTTPSDVPTRTPTMAPVSKPIDIDPRR